MEDALLEFELEPDQTATVVPVPVPAPFPVPLGRPDTIGTYVGTSIFTLCVSHSILTSLEHLSHRV